MKKIIFAAILIFLINAAAAAPKTILINKETANELVKIKYPQGISKNIDTAVREFIESVRKMYSFPEVKDLPENLPGKNSLYVNYKIKFNSKQALSLYFIVSTYGRGAAHPNSTVRTLNFIEGQRVILKDLFKPKTAYLSALAQLSETAILKKNISEKNWVTAGTAPKEDNYQGWYFTKEGLAVAFDPYQVAAYVYGIQTVKIPKQKLFSLLRPEVLKSVWSSHE